MFHTDIYVLTTELMIINALNVIDMENSQRRRICILIGRVATKEFFSALQSMNIFEVIYLIDFDPPKPKFWVRNSETRKHFSFFEVLKTCVSQDRHKVLRTRLTQLFPELKKDLQSASRFYFHIFNDFSKALFGLLNPKAERILLEEGVASYLKTTVPIQTVSEIRLYDPSLAVFRDDSNCHLFKAIDCISPNRTRLLQQIKTLFPFDNALSNGRIYLDQPLGQKPSALKICLSSHYRRQARAYSVRLSVIRNLFKTQPDLSIRLHPSSSLNDPRSSELISAERIQSTPRRVPFEIDLLRSNVTDFELYSIYSTASCYWRIFFSDDMLASKSIRVHVLYPSLQQQLPDERDSAIDGLLVQFFDRLAAKYPAAFFME